MASSEPIAGTGVFPGMEGSNKRISILLVHIDLYIEQTYLNMPRFCWCVTQYLNKLPYLTGPLGLFVEILPLTPATDSHECGSKILFMTGECF
jgi:hypothetical protein